MWNFLVPLLNPLSWRKIIYFWRSGPLLRGPLCSLIDSGIVIVTKREVTMSLRRTRVTLDRRVRSPRHLSLCPRGRSPNIPHTHLPPSIADCRIQDQHPLISDHQKRASRAEMTISKHVSRKIEMGENLIGGKEPLSIKLNKVFFSWSRLFLPR